MCVVSVLGTFYCSGQPGSAIGECNEQLKGVWLPMFMLVDLYMLSMPVGSSASAVHANILSSNPLSSTKSSNVKFLPDKVQTAMHLAGR